VGSWSRRSASNSTVCSHALYLIAQGGVLNGCVIYPQGKDVAQHVLMRGR
jgi:hypothetical protein